jgi:hypothetical protein
MKQELIKVLGLKEDASEENIVSAVEALAQNAKEAAAAGLEEKLIRAKMGAGMSRENAILAITHQREADAIATAKAKAVKAKKAEKA